MTAVRRLPARRYEPSPARAAAIREAREWAQMSQHDLARVLGVPQTAVSAWERAVRDPGPELAARIAVATRGSLSSLLAPSHRRTTGVASAGWPLDRKAAAA